MVSSQLYRTCAGLFVAGFPGFEPNAAIESLVDDGIAGVILFKGNVGSPGQVASLVRELKIRARRPFLASVDQEGGRVARLKGSPFTQVRPMREVGRARDAALAWRVGRLLAFEVRALGVDLDFAPVLDVDTNSANPVIGDRSLHSEAQEVARLGVALAQGLEAGGVASCGKHFPGHGDTAKDSHLDLPMLPHSLERLRHVELVPFEVYAKAKLASIMTAHVVFEALEPGVPATMSPRVLTGLLREELGFEGVVISDDLEMGAIVEHFSVERAAVDGLLAGVDLFLVCHHEEAQRRAIEAVVKAVESGEVPMERLHEASARVATLMEGFIRGAEDGLSSLGSPQHRALAEGLWGEASTAVDPTER